MVQKRLIIVRIKGLPAHATKGPEQALCLQQNSNFSLIFYSFSKKSQAEQEI